VINNVETLFGGSGDSAARRRMVCGPWIAQERRHTVILHFGPRQQARHLRIADGFPLRQMIEDVAGGMLNGRKLKAVDSPAAVRVRCCRGRN